MGKGSKSGACKSTSHQVFKDRAKNRVDDLQGIFSDLQSARKESRTIDVAVLEEQVHLMLREWKSELNEPSPASSLQQGGSLGFSSDIGRLLQLCEEEDDAISSLAVPKPDPDAQNVVNGSASQEEGSLGFSSDICRLLQLYEEDDAISSLAALKPDPDAQKVVNGSTFPEIIMMPKSPQEQIFPSANHSKTHAAETNSMEMSSMPAQLNYNSYDFHQEFNQQFLIGFDGTSFVGEDDKSQILSYQQNICPPPPSAFLGPKCALWDCPRPAQGFDWCQKSDDYCSTYHASLAPSEGYLGSPPVVRPRGIGLKDNLLFAALVAKSAGKEVGIPECEGAATAKSPWNAPELFDLNVLDGETIREWVFFDKPRRAFESGNRKQRSLPDYHGRGWHESRKQVVNEFGGLKRSYYMDPQPMESFEWHLYEYEVNKYDACALYRLEVKRAEGKKGQKGKLGNDYVADLQKQMNRLTAEFPNDGKQKGRGKNNSGSNETMGQGEGFDYGRYHLT